MWLQTLFAPRKSEVLKSVEQIQKWAKTHALRFEGCDGHYNYFCDINPKSASCGRMFRVKKTLSEAEHDLAFSLFRTQLFLYGEN